MADGIKVELKKVKVHRDMSEETECFSADIWVDGVKAGVVKNDGRGGCNIYYWLDAEKSDVFIAWAEAQPTEFAFDRMDQVIERIRGRQEALKRLARYAQCETLFRFKGDKAGNWRSVKAPFTPKVEEFLTKKYGDKIELIANNDLEAALAYC